MRKVLMLWCLVLGLGFASTAEAACLIEWKAQKGDSWPAGVTCLVPTLRVDLGSAFRVSPATETQFKMNVVGGALLAWPGDHSDAMLSAAGWLLPELGYSFRYNT